MKDYEDYSVEILEVEEIGFTEIKERLEDGESVFIEPKRKQKTVVSQVTGKDSVKGTDEPWYFTHT